VNGQYPVQRVIGPDGTEDWYIGTSPANLVRTCERVDAVMRTYGADIPPRNLFFPDAELREAFISSFGA